MNLRRPMLLLAVAALGLGTGCKPKQSSDADPSTTAAAKTTTPKGTTMTKPSYDAFTKPSDDQLKQKLSSLEFEVTQHDATEPPFQNKYWDNKKHGLYVDIVSGEPLFSSTDKFNSGTGWPSFTKPVEKEHVISKVDATHGMVRTEVRSKYADSHLGHVFEDGPAPTGLRYCINSASLRFIPVDQLEQQGYGAYLSLFGGDVSTPEAKTDNACNTENKASCETSFETAILAGGCFWGMEDILRDIDGVVDTDVGYAGGELKSPTYEDVKQGNTGHAESVRITFDPKKVSFEDILAKWFFKMHDPTTKNRQGNDVGTQYRSVIFYTTPEQKKTAEAVIKRVDASGAWGAPVVTELVKAGDFTEAEDYHQDYLEKNPGGYTCHFMRDGTDF